MRRVHLEHPNGFDARGRCLHFDRVGDLARVAVAAGKHVKGSGNLGGEGRGGSGMGDGDGGGGGDV